MQLNFSLWNHSTAGRASCYDIVDTLASQAQDLGHVVTFSPSCYPAVNNRKQPLIHDDLKPPPFINVFIECFGRNNIDILERAVVDEGLLYIVLMTEAWGRSGFNDGHGQVSDDLAERQRYAPRAMAPACGVGCLVMPTVKEARNHNQRSFYLEVGYSPSRARRLRNFALPLNDYAFSGGLGPRRKKMVAALQKAGLTVTVPSEMYGGLENRNALYASAKGALGLRAFDNWNIPSSSRFSTALHIGCYVAPELHNIETPWKSVLDWPRSQRLNDYVELARGLAERPGIAFERQFYKFSTQMGPEQTLQPFLESIFGAYAMIGAQQ